jgi:hypothetical protein
MGARSGIALQLGTAEETTYGTAVTPDRFFPIRSQGIKAPIGRNESEGIVPGPRVLRSSQWYAGKKGPAGPVVMEMETKGFGRWFKHMLGGSATTQPDAVASPTVYKHTFTPGDLPTGLTVQVGKPDVTTGTVHPFTYPGCVVGAWKIEQTVDGFAVVTVDLLGQDEDLDTALAVATYAAGRRQYPWVNTTYTIDGSPVNVSSWSIEGSNGLADDRYFMGSQLRRRPEEKALRNYSGTIGGEFESMTAYQRFVDGEEVPLVATFTGPIIEDALPFSVVITANVRFDGDTPEDSGREIVKQNLPYKVIDDETTSIKVEYQTTDATP